MFVGAAVSAMMIPQCLAYSLLAGLPPIIGLYTAWVTKQSYVEITQLDATHCVLLLWYIKTIIDR